MEIVSALFSGLIYCSLWAVLILIWAYAILSCVLPGEDTGVLRFLSFIAAPILLPFDQMTKKSGAGGGLFYLSPALASVVIVFVMAILP